MAAGQTVVTYNGISLTNCLTRRFHEEDVYDDSGTDLLYHKFTVSVVGYAHGDSTITSLGINPNPGGGSASAQHVSVRHALLQPRKSFVMVMGANAAGLGGSVLLEGHPASRTNSNLTYIDVNNGPKPRILSITHVSADQVLKVEFEIEICVLQCDFAGGASSNPTGVLSNRWSVTDEIDQNFYTTRTFTGRLRVASAITSPNQFRSWVVPPLAPGMQRSSMNFIVTTDGLNLDYTIVDKEVAWSAPAPATDWSVSYTESFGDFGITQFGEINIMLGGDRYADKKQMIAIAASIIENRLLPQGGVVGGDVIHRLLSYSITDISSNRPKNEIHAHARVQHMQQNAAAIRVAAGKLGKPIDNEIILGYDSDLSRGSRPGDDLEVEGPISLASAFHCYLQSSCSPEHRIVQSEGSPESSSGESLAMPSLDVRQVDELPDEPADYLSEGHQQNIYTHWRMESRYESSGLKVQLPIARSTSGSPGDDDPTSVVVSLGGGLTKRTIRIHGERLGNWPQIPRAEDFTDENGIEHTLMNKNILPDTPRRSPDGTQIFAVHADFEFALSRSPRDDEKLVVGVNPWESSGLYLTESDTLTGPQDGE